LQFLSKLPWMKGWPVWRLLCHPSQYFHKYMRKGSVIVPDSDRSDNLYVIMSGLCEVYMVVDSVTCSWQDYQRLMAPDGATESHIRTTAWRQEPGTHPPMHPNNTLQKALSGGERMYSWILPRLSFAARGPE
jgi:hypothetical protein